MTKRTRGESQHWRTLEPLLLTLHYHLVDQLNIVEVEPCIQDLLTVLPLLDHTEYDRIDNLV